MNKLKLNMCRIIFFVLVVLAFLQVASVKSYAAVGQSYSDMVSSYGQPESIALNKAVSLGNFRRYQAGGIFVSSYKFQIKGFGVIALFNDSNVCYEMKTFSNPSLPDAADFIGSLSQTKPVVINRVWLRSATLQYGTGTNIVIYKTFGFPGDLSAIAYSPLLKP